MTTRLDWALRYAGLGLAVFPTHSMTPADDLGLVVVCTCGRPDCNSAGKHPITLRGCLDASTDEAQIRDWWERTPFANIAVATGKPSGVYVVDLDGQDGIDAWTTIEDDYGDAGGVMSLTGGGGAHLWFALGEHDLSNTHWRVAAHVDTRGTGGYVVVPPSLHRSGRKYAWADGDTPTTIQEHEIPDWLVTLLGPRVTATPRGEARLSAESSAYGRAILRAALDRVRAAPEGARNNTLNAEAFGLGQWIAGGEIDPLGVAEALADAAPEPDPKMNERTIRGALRGGAEFPRTKEQP